jgi:hypothetical protein
MIVIVIIIIIFKYPRYLESRGLKAYTKNSWNYYYYCYYALCRLVGEDQQ